MTTFRRRFGQLIKENREAQGLTQAQLAKAMRTDQPTISRIESGGVGVQVELFRALMKRLGIDANQALWPKRVKEISP